jgi:2-polyprenyl-3-methyl-5-hydroxy-6-metoxy-1,4-benzoquinol methylase
MKKEHYIQTHTTTGHEEGLIRIPLRREFLLKHISPGDEVLDAGTCSGYFARMLMERGNRVRGLELNPESVEYARQQGVDVIQHDLEEPFPFSNDFFDIVIAYEIIEHLFDTEGFLKECSRVLKTGGKILISTPNLNFIVHRLRVLLGYHIHYLGTYPGDHHGDHIRIFNRKTITELLKLSGFSVTDIWGSCDLKPLVPLCRLLPTLAEYLLVCGIKQV